MGKYNYSKGSSAKKKGLISLYLKKYSVKSSVQYSSRIWKL